MFKIETEGANHTRAFTAAAIKPQAQIPTLKIAKCIAMTAMDIFCNKELFETMNREFKNSIKKV